MSFRKTILAVPIFILVVGVTFGHVFLQNAFAVVRTWDGGGETNNWNDCDNWSSNVCPTTSDVATFDGTSTKDVTINASINVRGIDINAGYSGVITQAAAMTIGADGYRKTQERLPEGRKLLT